MSADPLDPPDSPDSPDSSHGELHRLERERLDADRRYNDALTSLDRAIARANQRAQLSREDFAALATPLCVFLQQITAFVDTKDRELAARAAVRLTEHERALEAIPELRTQVAVLQRTVQMLKRELTEPTASARSTPTRAAPAAGAVDNAAAANVAYIAFEDRFRGTPAEIRAKLAQYVARFAGASDVLDVGCGRGEFLVLLKEHGIKARGVDANREMAASARERGVDAAEGDALAYLAGIPDASLGGLMAAQVIEHLEPAYLIRLLEVAFRKLRPGSPVVIETINPACWLAFFSSYLRDFTHVRPIHPDTLQYLLQASGFERVSIEYSAPAPEHVRMKSVELPPEAASLPDSSSAVLAHIAHIANANAAVLNHLLFTYLDYAAIGYRS
jgi:SAM-dependent methyltransferase